MPPLQVPFSVLSQMHLERLLASYKQTSSSGALPPSMTPSTLSSTPSPPAPAPAPELAAAAAAAAAAASHLSSSFHRVQDVMLREVVRIESMRESLSDPSTLEYGVAKRAHTRLEQICSSLDPTEGHLTASSSSLPLAEESPEKEKSVGGDVGGGVGGGVGKPPRVYDIACEVADVLIMLRQDEEAPSDFQDYTLVSTAAVAAFLLQKPVGEEHGLRRLAEIHNHDVQALDHVFCHILTRLSFYWEVVSYFQGSSVAHLSAAGAATGAAKGVATAPTWPAVADRGQSSSSLQCSIGGPVPTSLAGAGGLTANKTGLSQLLKSTIDQQQHQVMLQQQQQKSDTMGLQQQQQQQHFLQGLGHHSAMLPLESGGGDGPGVSKTDINLEMDGLSQKLKSILTSDLSEVCLSGEVKGGSKGGCW